MIPCLMVSTTHLWWFGEWFQIHPRSHGILWIPWSGNFQVPRPDIHFELVGPVEDLPEIRPFDPRFFMPVRTWTKDGKEPKFPLNDTIYDIYKLNFNRIYIYMYIIYTCIYKMDSIHIYIYIEMILEMGTAVMYWRVIPREPGGLKPWKIRDFFFWKIQSMNIMELNN